MTYVNPTSTTVPESQACTAKVSEGDPDTGRQDVRCCCGSLLAKLVEGGVELKCRRCKRIVTIPFSRDDEDDD
ncbi:MAG: hypothetical protein KC933_20245 [Myxococcales bacterium]|nr:hypothetical protein [Myxococcales bacterium]MCB9651488.1 hypothetical protein [Deltaproteobacteria bacterium]